MSIFSLKEKISWVLVCVGFFPSFLKINKSDDFLLEITFARKNKYLTFFS